MLTNNKPFRVGILGGMGPMAGIELHKLIIDATPASCDQDHIQVVLFTNPSIPDRTRSLHDDDGKSFAAAAGKSVASLEKMNPDVLAMACMTAHSRIQQIQTYTKIPILSGIPLVHTALNMHYPNKRIALLATPGSISSGVYNLNQPKTDWLVPDAKTQQQVTDAIYTIKAGQRSLGLRQLIKAMDILQSKGAQVFILGCTELGLLFNELQRLGHTVLDPMRLMAQQIVILNSLRRPIAGHNQSQHHNPATAQKDKPTIIDKERPSKPHERHTSQIGRVSNNRR